MLESCWCLCDGIDDWSTRWTRTGRIQLAVGILYYTPVLWCRFSMDGNIPKVNVPDNDDLEADACTNGSRREFAFTGLITAILLGLLMGGVPFP